MFFETAKYMLDHFFTNLYVYCIGCTMAFYIRIFFTFAFRYYMKTIEIKASQFFEILKLNDTSMWSIFAQMIDGEQKKAVFLDDDGKILFTYQLPNTIEQLKADQGLFSEEYIKRIKESL